MSSQKILGRDEEIKTLNEDYEKNRSSIVVIFGRRRVGKSYLIKNYAIKKPALHFEALEKEKTSVQIMHFVKQLAKQTDDKILAKSRLDSWEEVFDYLTKYLANQKKKTILFFDEFQWMAAGQSKLVSLVKFYWDNQWKQHSVQLILCGSISSYMVQKVIKSKALYGRIDLEMCIQNLMPADAKLFFKNKINEKEVLDYLLLFGGIPKYLELLDPKYTFDENIQNLCFKKEAYFQTEYEKVFYSQFKKHKIHEKIVQFLANSGPLNLEEISKKTKIPSGGGLLRYLHELELAQFIQSYSPTIPPSKKGRKYKLSDEFLIFYFKYILPSQKTLNISSSQNYFKSKVKPVWNSWKGIQFENFCRKNASVILGKLKINDEAINIGPYFEKNNLQVDILIQTNQNRIYACECKYSNTQIDSDIFFEVENKMKILSPKKQKLFKVLITNLEPNEKLTKAKYFDFVITLKDFLKTH